MALPDTCSRRSARVTLVALAAASLSLVLSAAPDQGNAPASAPGQPAQVQPARGTQPPPADAQGRGRGRGRSGPSLGGPSLDDPAYENVDFSPRDPVLPLSPAEQVATFWLPEGFRIAPVLSEPDIQEPGQIAFDGNGRMFVVELRGYMQDKDGNGTLLPTGRISAHRDLDNDGVYEDHTVFVDNLVFPRFVMPYGRNAVLTKESNADELWKFTDTNGDGTADKKELVGTGFGRMANVEHQESGLMWAMDNWLYTTVNQFRFRITPSGVVKEPTGSNSAQWGTTQDNYGKVWFQAGFTGMPGYFQLPVVYGNFNYPDQFEPDLNITWGAPVLVADMQPGMSEVRMPDGSLKHATGSAGNDVFRGDRLPADLVGDYFYGEPVARIVRRLVPTTREGLTQLRNAYPRREFLRSIDPLFRPVDVTTAPDGTMYITDMYRGIIQESQWSGPGTYLRARIEQYQLDKVVRHGRIWRITYEGMPRDSTPPRMLDETPAQLVTHLSHPNGWWRDTAQQLLVMAGDRSVVPALQSLVETSPNQLARIHALWTLEGLEAADPALLRAVMQDADPQLRIHAIRVSESLYKDGDRSFADDYKRMASDTDTEVVMQALMTLNTLRVPGAADTIKSTGSANSAAGVTLVANTILSGGGRGRGFDPGGRGGGNLTPAELSMMERGQTIYTELCFACHGDDGRGAVVEGTNTVRAPSLVGAARVLGHRDYVIKTLLHGMTGPVDGQRFTEVMIPMGMNDDEWIASIGSYIRNSFGNQAPFIRAEDVARVRAATASRETSWTIEDLEATLPQPVVVGADWQYRASHNDATAAYATTMQPWSTGGAQQPGMWFQVGLPDTVRLTEIQFESSALEAGAGATVLGAPPRTGGGRGGRGGPAPEIGYPRGYRVEVSLDGTNWRQVAEGQGSGSRTVITFSPAEARYVRITQTGGSADSPPWSIQQLRLFRAPDPS